MIIWWFCWKTLMILQKKTNNPNWPQILDYPYKVLIIGGSGYGKTISLFNLISHQGDIDKNLFIC